MSETGLKNKLLFHTRKSSMSNRERRKYSGGEKVKILRLHLLEHKPISEVCEEQGIHPTLFYKWQKEFLENGAAAFDYQLCFGASQSAD
jgi:transposase-like protein